MQPREARDIVIATAALTIAFAIAFADGLTGIFQANVVSLLLVSFVAVATGFVLHELGHRFLSHRYGYYAEFQMWPFGVGLALLFSFLGFVFAAPGAVVIHPKADIWGRFVPIEKRKYALVSLIGPAVNMVLAGAFILAHMLAPLTLAGIPMFVLAAQINLWLALFNMIPFPPLDGSKVFAWRKDVWGVFFGALLVLFVVGFIF